MNRQELKEWKRSVNCYACAEDEYDQQGNHFQTFIFEKDGKLYSISYCNSEPKEVWGKKGYIRGVYEPVEVTRHTEIIKRVYYKPVKKE